MELELVHPLLFVLTGLLLQSCIKLAQGQLTPTTMSSELLQGLSVGKPLHRRLSDHVVQGWTSSSERSLAHSVIQMMETLMDHSQHAKDCCRRILICYKISVVSYHLIATWLPHDRHMMVT